MAHTLRSHTATITVTGGTGAIDSEDFTSANALVEAGGYIEQVIISMPNKQAEFDFLIETPNGLPAFRRKGKQGELIENTHTPIRGVYDFTISDATMDGAYSIELIVKEEW